MLGSVQAAYTVKVPAEVVTFKNPSNWQPYDPEYTEWVSQGEPYDCTNWKPDPSEINLGETFEQTATDCKQEQTRTRQDREQETTTLAIRYPGSAVTKIQTITASSTKTETGTGSECRYQFGVYQWTTEGNVNTHIWPHLQ